MKQLEVKILENRKIAQDFYKMRLESPYLAANTKPGQFFEVKCSESGDPLLRRPLGAHRILKNGIELLYKIVGRGTVALSGKNAGERLDIIGPLGNGFTLSRAYPVLIAGGTGVAPLVALAEELTKRKNRPYIIIGARTRAHLLCEKELAEFSDSLKVVTEDGSKGPRGLATAVLEKYLSVSGPRVPAIYACGPTAMLKAVAGIAGRKRIPCQVSLEEKMACGVGVCLGCPVKMKGKGEGYKMVCKDGPVFNAEEIAW